MSRPYAPGSGLSDFHSQASGAFDAGPAMLAAPRPRLPELPADIAFLARHGLAPDLLASIASVAARKRIPACEVLIARGHLTAGAYRQFLALETGAAHAEIVTPAQPLSAERWSSRDVPDEMPVLGRHAGASRIFVPADAARLGKLIAFAQRGRGLLRPFVLVPPAAIRIAHLMRNRSAHTRRAILALDEAMPEYSARRRVSKRQVQAALALSLCFAWSFLLLPGMTEAVIAGLLILFYLATIFLRVYVLTLLDTLPWPRQDDGTREPVPSHPEAEDLPLYSILVPLYREPGQVGELVRAIAAIDWPASKREVFLVCEEDDAQTLDAIRAGGLPEGFHLVCCPDSFPRTKPKALNFALPLAKGEFTVVYDAEDRPHPQQLREACRVFRAGNDRLACLQAPLVTGNGDAGWLSAMFGVEYDTLFRGTIPALATIGGPVPLGGTSNHFRTDALRACLGWDAWNVTEDADLGLRLARMGYRCGTIERPTLEEAPETLHVWMRQRTRWLKGWMQTILVHMRDPLRLRRELGWGGFIVFQLSMTTIVASVLAHPLVLAHAVWTLGRVGLGHDLSARQFAYVGLDLFSITASYATYGLLAGAVARRCGKRVGLHRQLALPAYWLLISAAGWRAALQFVREPFKWEKTEHGLAKSTVSAKIETSFTAKDAWPAQSGEIVDPEAKLTKWWSLQQRGARILGLSILAAAILMPLRALADCASSAAPGVNWTDCRKRNLMLDGNDLSGSNMTGADLTSTDLRGATLVDVQFVKAGLGRAMLDNSKAEGTNFEKAQGFRTSFVKADMKGANFAKSEMQRADFTGAVLTGADFTKSELGRAIFVEAELTGTKFALANLARADFRGATFDGAIDFAQAYLYRTRLEGLDLSKATGLEQWQVDLACGDDKTVLPAGITPHGDWPCAEE